MSESFRERLKGYFKKGETKLERFANVKVKKGEFEYVDNTIKNLDSMFNSIDLIVNNSSYQPEYLKKIYVVEFFKILQSVEKKLKDGR